MDIRTLIARLAHWLWREWAALVVIAPIAVAVAAVAKPLHWPFWPTAAGLVVLGLIAELEPHHEHCVACGTCSIEAGIPRWWRARTGVRLLSRAGWPPHQGGHECQQCAFAQLAHDVEV